MISNLSTLYDDLMQLCASNEAFYYVDQHFAGNHYRVFTYRLASYTDFVQNRNAVECRGHTFMKNEDDEWVLVSLPMQKFFNYGEHVGWGTALDLNNVAMVMDKLDGSLISTVRTRSNAWFLKSKTSFNSKQAIDAKAWLYEQREFVNAVSALVRNNYTVNFEWVAPDNQIVVGYNEPKLIALNARHMLTGEYLPYDELKFCLGEENTVKSIEGIEDYHRFILEADKMTGIEGFIICFADGLWVKHKTEAYCVLHKTKDAINTPRKLWEACVMETADDLRALFRDDPISIQKIVAMEEMASKAYTSVHKSVYNFFNENKDLDRKSYAIKGQELLKQSGTFSIAMNLYLGKEADIKGFLIKNYKQFGVSEEEGDTVNE